MPNTRTLTPLMAAVAMLMLAGCTTVRETLPQQSATEQLLISTAADHMVVKLSPQFTPGTKVFVDSEYFEGVSAKYTIGTIRDRLLKAGAFLVADRTKADTIVEIRAGAHSVDQHDFLIGIPEMAVPVPLSGSLSFPEIALFKKDVRNGVVKVAVTAYDAKTGALQFSLGPEIGASARTKWVVLLLFSWTTTDLVPNPDNIMKEVPH
jgi:hypothetical protein